MILDEIKIKGIPEMVERGMTIKQIAETLQSTPKTITNWIKKLRTAGIEVRTKKGRPPVKLADQF